MSRRAATGDRRPAPLSLVRTIAISTVLLLEGMSSSGINTQINTLGVELRIEPADLQLIAGVFLVAYAGCLPAAGRLVDVWNKRAVFQVGVVLFGLGCLLCAGAENGWWLVLGRFVQGAGAAFSAPATLALITAGFSTGRSRNRAMGIYSAMGAVGFSAGLVVPGFIIAEWGWRASFLVYLPLVLAIFFVVWNIAVDHSVGSARVDVLGTTTVTGAMILLVNAIGGLTSTSGWTTCLQLVGAVGLGLMHAWRARHRDARIFPTRVIRSPLVLCGCLSLAGVFAGIVTSMYLISITLQTDHHCTPFQVGLALVPQSIANGLLSIGGARLVTRYGAVRMLTTGLGVITAGLSYLGLVGLDRPYFIGLLPAAIFIGSGVALSYPAASILAIDGVEARDRGGTAGLLTTFQNVGGSLGLAVATALALVPTADRPVDPSRGMLVSAAFVAIGGLAAHLAIRWAGPGRTVDVTDGSKAVRL